MRERVLLLREDLFQHNMKDFFNRFSELLSILMNRESVLTNEGKEALAVYCDVIGIYINKGDYLTAVDVVQFELLPYFETKEH